MTAMNQAERGTDGRYSAYGMRNGRPFVADAETLKLEAADAALNDYEFMLGDLACFCGDPCPADASESFKRGYGVRYEFEQMMTSRHGR